MSADRRTFLKAIGAGAIASQLPLSIKKALAIPAHHRTGTIADVEHIVFLMQENRSFDHYFGTLRGVRGFGDPRAVKLPSGLPVWYQPTGTGTTTQVPFHPNEPDLGLVFFEDLGHGWADQHDAWNHGKYDNWVPAKANAPGRVTTMAYLTRDDIPFYFALADAFTVCDNYFCSVIGPTDPNRYHMWTGWVGNDGNGGGPVLNNAEAGYDWSTFPERLEKAGISWKVYQDAGQGLDAAHYWGWGPPYIGNYGDNALLYFHQYQSSQPGSALFEKAVTGTNILQSGTLVDIFAKDVAENKLPQVSWIVAPEAYTEHPNWPTNYGAWYIAQFLDALTANPDVWSKTVFVLMFDENDGFFDHIVPPTPPESRAGGLSTVDTINEVFPGNASFAPGPIGLGFRVPCIVISPWSKGGYVCSEVFDHTSLIQFVEARFGKDYPDIIEPNITPWRRAVTGDLTSALNFKSPNAAVVPLPNTDGYKPPTTDLYPDYVPPVPTDQTLPVQEPGLRPARALPYELHVSAEIDAAESAVKIRFGNTGKAAAVYQVRSGDDTSGPWTYTVGPDAHLFDTWPVSGTGYDLSVYGPNGFLREYKGSIGGKNSADLSVKSQYDSCDAGITLDIHNRGGHVRHLSVYDAYDKKTVEHALAPGKTFTWHWQLDGSFGWYDLTITVDSDPSFKQQLAGHVETGKDSMSDPLLGG